MNFSRPCERERENCEDYAERLCFWRESLTALGAGWLGFPRVIYQSQPQPVDFSHKVHADKAGSKCEDCHAFRDDGTFAGMPTLDKCAACHAAAMGDTAAEKNFIDQYVTPQREPVWLVIRTTAGECLLLPRTAREPRQADLRALPRRAGRDHPACRRTRKTASADTRAV